MTPGNAYGPALRWCRPTPGSSTAARCGDGACTRDWRAGPGRPGSRRSALLRLADLGGRDLGGRDLGGGLDRRGLAQSAKALGAVSLVG
jgi:hypothetical protein